jgi:adenylate cyclase class IV
MARNIEAKFADVDLAGVAERARRAGAADLGVLVQRDTFFGAQRARLKLREHGGQPGAQLIGYRRADVETARASDYIIYETSDPIGLAETLRLSLGVCAVVEKRRHLLILENTRIHLDQVAELGDFVELETVLGDSLTDTEGAGEFARVQVTLGLSTNRIVPVAYTDLLTTQR